MPPRHSRNWMRNRNSTSPIFLETELPSRLIAGGFAGMEDKEVFARRIVFCFSNAMFPDIEKFNFTTNDRVRWNMTRHTRWTVCEVRADGDFPAATDTHTHDPIPQTGNALALLEVNHHSWSCLL